jgi:hypothetical protein
MTDDGRPLPSHIITDVQLRYPETLGRYPFVSAVSVTGYVVTLTIQAANILDSGDGPPGFTPVAVVSVNKDALIEGRQYPLKAQYPGVGGWVSFGSGAEDYEWTGRFSQPSQALLSARAAKGTSDLPIKSLSKAGADAKLTGVVQLLGASPLAIVGESREIENEEQDVIVFRLEQPDPGSTETVGTELNVLKEFAGPCSGRPESGTCPSDPIEFINSVGPDCDGVLKLKFLGCASPASILSECGIVLDCEIGLTEACAPPHIPDDIGRLPDEYTPFTLPSPQVPPVDDPGVPDEPPEDPAADLPYMDCFDVVDQSDRIGSVGSGTAADDFTVVSGDWILVADDTDCPLDSICHIPCSDESESRGDCHVDDPMPTPTASQSYSTEGDDSLSLRNISILDFGDNSTANRRLRTDIKLLVGSENSKTNGGVVINYRDHGSLAGRKVYYYAELDYDNQEFALRFFNGTFMSDVLVQPLVGQIQHDNWYRIEISTIATSQQTEESGHVDITVKLTDPCGGLSVQIGPLATANYLPSSGLFGFAANRAHTRFSYVRVDEN